MKSSGMTRGEIFVPAAIEHVITIDPGEVRAVTLKLPETVEIDGRTYPLCDEMRPGNAFLAKPAGTRTGKIRRRMYTRSNCAEQAPLSLETIINHTHEPKADTSVWWQSDQVEALHTAHGTIDVRVVLDPHGPRLVVFENTATDGPRNLRLEPDGEWETMRMVGLALSTGITPFLAYVRYMSARAFGRSDASTGCHLVLIASVRNPRQLMAHEELLEIQRAFPDHFRYHPVLTREWPDDWPYGKGRIIRSTEGNGPVGRVDLDGLLGVVPDLSTRHLRFCGNAQARDQLQRGLEQQALAVSSFRAEVW